MFDDDLDPRKKKPAAKPLDPVSIPELKEYIARLREEIVRAETEIAKKEKLKSAADAIFKSG